MYLTFCSTFEKAKIVHNFTYGKLSRMNNMIAINISDHLWSLGDVIIVCVHHGRPVSPEHPNSHSKQKVGRKCGFEIFNATDEIVRP